MAQERKITNGLLNDLIIHPGETLKEILEERLISQKELALCTGVSSKHISSILSGKTDISISYAKKLEYALGIDAQFWINLQSNYDRESYEYKEANSISKDELNILKELKEVIVDFQNQGFLDRSIRDYILVLELRSLLCVSNLCDIPKLSYAAAYRISKNVNPYVLYSWQKMCEIKNKYVSIDSELNIDKLKSSIGKIKETMFLNADIMQDRLKDIFAECGIVFDIVHNYKGAPVQGYIKQIIGNKLLLCMTIRGKYIDIFWFTLFHEIAHIINGDTKNIFIDFNCVDDVKEAKADTFAKNALIDYDKYISFLNTDYKNKNNIFAFAKKCGVDPSIVVGRMLKEDLIDYPSYGKLRKQYEWCE